MIVLRLPDNNMPRFSPKLAILIMSTLLVTGYISWTHLPDSDTHLRIEKDEVQLNRKNANFVEVKEMANLVYPAKIAIGLQDNMQQADNNNLPQNKESPNQTNQRTDNETPQLIEKRDTVEQIKEEVELAAKSSEQGKVNAAEPEGEGHQNRRIETFFSTLPISFSDFKTEEEGGIPTKEFLEACTNLLPFLDKFGRKTMTFAHADLTGNAEKIHKVYEGNPEASETLQKMVLHEFENGDYLVDGKGTISLLWLKRGFDFVVEFLRRMSEYGEDPPTAAGSAYDNHLAMHHNFIIRGSFRLAFKTLPFRHDFFTTLAMNKEDADSPDLDRIVAEDITIYNEGIERTFKILRDFYTDHGLDN